MQFGSLLAIVKAHQSSDTACLVHSARWAQLNSTFRSVFRLDGNHSALYFGLGQKITAECNRTFRLIYATGVQAPMLGVIEQTDH